MGLLLVLLRSTCDTVFYIDCTYRARIPLCASNSNHRTAHRAMSAHCTLMRLYAQCCALQLFVSTPNLHNVTAIIKCYGIVMIYVHYYTSARHGFFWLPERFFKNGIKYLHPFSVGLVFQYSCILLIKIISAIYNIPGTEQSSPLKPQSQTHSLSLSQRPLPEQSFGHWWSNIKLLISLYKFDVVTNQLQLIQYRICGRSYF